MAENTQWGATEPEAPQPSAKTATGGAAQVQAAHAEQQTMITTSRGFIDLLVTNRLSLALTS